MTVRRVAAALTLLFTALTGTAAPAGAVVPVAEYTVPDDGVATCLRDAGDGRFALLGDIDRTSTTMDLLHLSDAVLAPASATNLGWLASCPAVAGADGGGVAMAGPAVTEHPRDRLWEEQMRVADAGGLPQPLGASVPASYDSATLAVNASGAAVLAWIDTRASLSTRPYLLPSRLLVALRPAGATAFGPAVVLDPALPRFTEHEVVAGIDAAGRATLAWVSGRPRALNPPVVVATTDAHGAFTIRQSFTCCAISDLALTVNADGRALLATLSGPPRLYERPPGEHAFTELAPLAGTHAISPTNVALGLGDGGEAVVAMSGDNDRVSVTTRPAGGAFGPLTDLTHPPSPEGDGSTSAVIVAFGGDRPSVPDDSDGAAALSAAVDGDQVAVAWMHAPTETSGAAPYAAFGTVSGGYGAPARLGSPCRAADAVRAVVLPDGDVAVAWADNGRTETSFLPDFPSGAGRLSIVRAGATPASDAAPPEVRATLARTGPLHVGDPLRVRVRCANGPCDVRVRSHTRGVMSPWWTPPRPNGVPPEIFERGQAQEQRQGEAVGATMPVRLAATVRLRPSRVHTFAPPGEHTRGRISVLACSPDGTRTTALTLRPRLRGAALHPMPRIVSATAARHGARVRVTVDTDLPLHGTVIATGRPSARTVGAVRAVAGHGRRHVRIVLSGTRATPIRNVEVQIANRDGLYGPPRTITVR